MKISFTETDITPRRGVELAGFETGSRLSAPSGGNGVDYLLCSILLFEHGRGKCCVLSLDLLWIDAGFVSKLKREICDLIGSKPSDILVCTTHTHSGPQLLPYAQGYGAMNREYRESLFERIISGVVEADRHYFDGYAVSGSDRIEGNLLANRICFGRSIPALKRDIFMSANPSRYVDHHVRHIAFYDENNSLKGLVVSLSCHPVFHRGKTASADYPGVLRERLREKYGKGVGFLFLQGFSGDIRPNYLNRSLKSRFRNLIRHGRFVGSFRMDIEGRADMFVQRLIESMHIGSAEEKTDVFHRLASRQIEFYPHGEHTGDVDSSVVLQRLLVPGGVTLVGVGGEVFSIYKQRLDRIASSRRLNLWPVGCANGMYGYLPDEEVLAAAGGYEYDSWRDFGRSGPLGRKFAPLLREKISQLFDERLNSEQFSA